MKLRQGVGLGLILLGIYVAFFGIPSTTPGTVSIAVSGVTISEISVRQVESFCLGGFFVLVGASLLKRS